jgi:hypothetical protein
MKLIERFRKETPKKNKIIGQAASVLSLVSLTIAESGIVDNRPVLRLGLEVLSVKLAAVAVYNGQKIVKDGQVNN